MLDALSRSLGGHGIEDLNVVVTLGLISLPQLGVAADLGVQGLQVFAELGADLILAGDDEHPADRSVDFLCLGVLHFLDCLEGELRLHLLALSKLEGALANAQLLNCGQELSLVFTKLQKADRLIGGMLPVCYLPYFNYVN